MKLQNYSTKWDCCVGCLRTVFVVIILHSHESTLLNSLKFYASCIWRRRAKYEYDERSIWNTRFCRIILERISLMASLSMAVDKWCIGCGRLSVLYNCFVKEDDNRDTLYIQFVTWNVPCYVIVYNVVWCVSKVSVLFKILVLLMQFP